MHTPDDDNDEGTYTVRNVEYLATLEFETDDDDDRYVEGIKVKWAEDDCWHSDWWSWCEERLPRQWEFVGLLADNGLLELTLEERDAVALEAAEVALADQSHTVTQHAERLATAKAAIPRAEAKAKAFAALCEESLRIAQEKQIRLRAELFALQGNDPDYVSVLRQAFQ